MKKKRKKVMNNRLSYKRKGEPHILHLNVPKYVRSQEASNKLAVLCSFGNGAGLGVPTMMALIKQNSDEKWEAS